MTTFLSTVLNQTSAGLGSPYRTRMSTDSMTVWAAADLVKCGCPIAFMEESDVLHRFRPSGCDRHPARGYHRVRGAGTQPQVLAGRDQLARRGPGLQARGGRG